MLVVIVVVDRHADIVEHGRGPEQLPFFGLARVNAGSLQRIPDTQSEMGHVLLVHEVVVVLRREIADAGFAHVGDKRRIGGGEKAGEEDALAQAGFGHLDAVEATDFEHGPQHGGAREDDLCAPRLHARHTAALPSRPRGQFRFEVGQGVAREDEALHARGRQGGPALSGIRQVAHGAT